MLGKLKMKLVISLVAVIMAVALLASVTFAWLSVSTSPEVSAISFNINMYHTLQVSLSQDGPWGENVSLAVLVSDSNLVKMLQPVSTLDGINWFACTYDDGTLNEVALFERSSTLEWGNVSKLATFTDASGTDLTNEEDILEAAEAQSHFIYMDIWLRSEDPNGCKVRLSVPHEVVESELGGLYGSYVMGKYVVSGTDEIVCNSNGAETAVRIGFQIYASGSDAEPTDFIIYEPNADKRSSAADKETAGEYVVGYSYSTDSYQSTKYIKTQPIGWLPTLVAYPAPALYYVNNDGYMVPISGTNLVSGTDYYVFGTDYVSSTDTPEPWDTDPNYVKFSPPLLYADNEPVLEKKTAQFADTSVTYYYDTGYSAQLANVDPAKIIVQKSCDWNLDKVKNALQLGRSPDSTCIGSFGSFLNTDEIYASSDKYVPIDSLSDECGSNAVLLTLPDDKPVKIRIFIWVEGQDPDCWNDIHTGTFSINVEFAGETD